MKKKILAVVGATASGKTDMAISLAKEFDGEIVSADSMQIYKGMDIATAKPSKEEMQGIPHHLIDFLERDVSFSVADYVKLANEKISDIISRGKLPIIAGGTGLYIDSLLNNVKKMRNTARVLKNLLKSTAMMNCIKFLLKLTLNPLSVFTRIIL